MKNVTISILIALPIYLAIAGIIIYFIVLCIKALRKYLRSGEVRNEKKAVAMSLGEALKENRERCHMTQEFVAEAIGVSRQAVSKWETGTSDPSTSNLIALAKLFDVSAGSFMPAPKVDSSVIRLDIRPDPPVEISDEKFFFRVVKAAFGQRRKTASNSLSAGLGIPKDKINAAIEAAELPASVRAESLGMENLARLSECIAAQCR